MLGKLVRCALGVIVFLGGSYAHAKVSSRFTVQGVLRNSQGQLQSMMVSVIASLWDAQMGGTRLGDPYGPQNVMAENGLFTIAFDDPALKDALASPSVSEVWLEVTVGAETLPRQLVTAQLFAMLASRADGLSQACSGCVADPMIATGLSGTKLKAGSVPTSALVAPAGGKFTSNLPLVSLGTTDTVVETITVTVPSAGVLFASASGSVYPYNHVSGTEDQVICFLNTKPGSPSGGMNGFGTPAGLPSFSGKSFVFPMAITAAFPVTAAGQVTVQLTCRIGVGCPGGAEAAAKIQTVFLPSQL